MNPKEAWQTAYNQLEVQLDKGLFNTWLRSAEYLNMKGNTFYIAVPNDFACEMLQERLYPSIQRVLSDVIGQNAAIKFEVFRQSAQTEIKIEKPVANDTFVGTDMPLFQLMAKQLENNEEPSDQPLPAKPNMLHEALRRPSAPTLPESHLNPALTFERFISNKSNQIVYEAAKAVAEKPAYLYNPFLIYGGVGLGKTHLLQAIAHECESRGYSTIYVPSEAFTNELIHAIRNRTTAMFRDKYRSVDVLLVDDIQFIAGKETTQEEFFHTFNTLVSFNKQIVMVTDRHPRNLDTLDDRLRSRFQGGLVTDIQPPEYETRLAILQNWGNDSGLHVPSSVLESIAQAQIHNIREMKGVFIQVLAQIRSGNTRIDLPQFGRNIHPMTHTYQPQNLSFEQILDTVARDQGFSTKELLGKKRTERINRARQITIYLMREMTDESFPNIGKYFDRSHTTILHAYNKISDELQNDLDLAETLDRIKQNFTSV